MKDFSAAVPLSVSRSPNKNVYPSGLETATVAGRLQTLRHCTGRTVTFSSSAPIAAFTAANMSGPTTLPSELLHVVQTLTTTAPRDVDGAGPSAGSVVAGSSAEMLRSITGPDKDPLAGRELCWVALTAVAVELAPVGCTPPRRLQSTIPDGRSPGSRVVAWSPPSREIPVASARARRLQLRGQRRR